MSLNRLRHRPAVLTLLNIIHPAARGVAEVLHRADVVEVDDRASLIAVSAREVIFEVIGQAFRRGDIAKEGTTHERDEGEGEGFRRTRAHPKR